MQVFSGLPFYLWLFHLDQVLVPLFGLGDLLLFVVLEAGYVFCVFTWL